MKQNVNRKIIISLLVMATMPGSTVFAGEGNVSASYLYTLSNFTGVYAVSWGGLSVDEAANEIYVAAGGQGIKIFSDTGMEIYSFNDEQELGNVGKVAVDDEGNIIALAGREKGFELIRCNYRGEPVSKIELKNVPAEFAIRSPTDIIFRNGSLYLVDEVSMKVVVTDREGIFKNGYDLASLLGFTEQQRADTGLGGFNVGREGDLLFTISPLAKAYVVSSDRTVRPFGKSGSTPGSFGVPGGIVADISGKYILVSDILRCRIVVFEKDNLHFSMEFGYRGLSPDAFIDSLGLAVDNRNRLT
jgi:DNA-binding beta-propeller fold protein YncE